MGTFANTDLDKTDEVSSPRTVSGWKILGSFYSLLLMVLTLELWPVLEKFLDRCDCGAVSRVSRQFLAAVEVRVRVRVEDRVRVRVGLRGWVRVGASGWVRSIRPPYLDPTIGTAS